MRNTQRSLLYAAVLGCFFLAPLATVSACPFCVDQRGPTLLGDFDQAAMVLVGTFKNATFKGDIDGGSTEFHITRALKSHEKVIDTKTKKLLKKIVLPRYVPKENVTFIIFCDVYKGVIDPYRGIELEKDSELIDYLDGAIKYRKKPVQARLQYCFKWLNHPEFELSIDAYREYAKADYDDYKEVAKKFDPEIVAGWLSDPKTPSFRYGLYGSLLGIAGKEKHIDLLKKMIEDPKKRRSSGIDGLLVGYMVLLDKYDRNKEGLTYLRGLMSDTDEEFLMRYAVLRTLRFFWYTRKDVLNKEQIVDAVSLTLRHPDMADFAIEDLRKWKQWQKTEDVLKLTKLESHDVPVIRRAVLRFALQCDCKTCGVFVSRQDEKRVEETKSLLDLESKLSN